MKAMIYVFVVGIFCVPIYLFLSKYLRFYKLPELSQIQLHNSKIISNPTSNRSEFINMTDIQQRRLQYLNQIIEFPLIGHMFYQQKIIELVEQGKYTQAIKEAQRALEHQFHSRSFGIWYHKAASQCLMKKLKDCEDSLRMATVYSNNIHNQRHLKDIYQILWVQSKKQAKDDSDSAQQITTFEEDEENTRMYVTQPVYDL